MDRSPVQAPDPRASCTVRNGQTAPPDGNPGAQPSRRRRLLVALTLLAVGVLAVDQVTKVLAENYLERGDYIPLLGDLFGLSLVYNPGAAFSFASGMTWIFTIVAVVVAVVIIGFASRLGSRGWAISLGLLLGGNLGNLVDRLFREPGFARGHVVDMLNYAGFFVGNVADIAIVVGAVWIAVLAFLGINVDGARAADTDAEADTAEADSDDPDTGDDAEASLDSAGARETPAAASSPDRPAAERD